MSGEPSFSIDFTARMLSTEPCNVGDCLVYDPNLTDAYGNLGVWRVASAANRATADSTTQAIALTAYGNSPTAKVTYQAAGVIAAEISGLGQTTAGLYQLVRTSTTGRLERIASYTAGDDVVGYAEPNGRVCLHIGLPWQLINGVASGVAPPVGSIQYDNSGAPGGAAHASISSDGYTQHSADRSGGAALTGDDRFAALSSVVVRASASAVDRVVWRHQYFTVTGQSNVEQIAFGYDGNINNAFDGVVIAATKVIAAGVGIISGHLAAGYYIHGPGFYTAAPNVRHFHVHPNLMLAPDTAASVASMTYDPFGGGLGYVYIADLATAATGNPTAGGWLWSDPTTHHPFWQTPGGTVYDLAAPSGGFAAGGDLTGSSSSQTVSKLQTYTLTIGTPSTGQMLTYNGSAFVPAKIDLTNGSSQLTGSLGTSNGGTGLTTTGASGTTIASNGSGAYMQVANGVSQGNGTLNTSNGSGGWNSATGTSAGSSSGGFVTAGGYFSVGGSVASAGYLRVPATSTSMIQADTHVAMSCVGTSLVFGSDTSFTSGTTFSNVYVNGTASVELRNSGTTLLKVDTTGVTLLPGVSGLFVGSSNIQVGLPRIGNSTAFASEGAVTVTGTGTTTATTLTSAQYSRRTIKLITFASYGNAVFPLPASADASYEKILEFDNSTSLTVTLTNGGATTLAITTPGSGGAGSVMAALFVFKPGGVYQRTALTAFSA